MKAVTSRVWLAVGGIAALLLIIFYLSGGFHAKVAPGTVADAAAVPVPDPAATFPVETTTVRPVIEVVGTMASEENVHLSSRVNTYVSRVEVSAGSVVTRGQLLIELDDRELQQQLKAAEADFIRAETENRRTQELYRTEAATRRQKDAAEAAYQSAEARLEEIQVLISHTRITAPIDGVVVDRRVEAGDLAMVGEVLLTVYDPGRMRLEAPVPLRLAGRLQPGDELQVELDTAGALTTGTVQEIVAAVDAQSRTRLVKVLLARQADGDTLPGMFGRLRIPGDPRPAIRIPGTAVTWVGQLPFVQVVQDGEVRRRVVRLGSRSGDEVEVLAGLKDGETILSRPLPLD